MFNYVYRNEQTNPMNTSRVHEFLKPLGVKAKARPRAKAKVKLLQVDSMIRGTMLKKNITN
jgi:hypothetical protein